MDYQEKQYRQKITLGQSGNALVMLIAICLIVFVGLAFLKAVWFFRFNKEIALFSFNKNVLGMVVLPADTDQLLRKPWTIITHMFAHDNVWKVFGNMLWLWCFGYILQDLTGNRRIIPVFIYGALGGAIAFIAAYNLIPSLKDQVSFVVASGAAPAVMAVAVVTTIVSPTYKLFPMINGGIPLWILTMVYVVSSLLTISFSDTGAIIVSLAGAVTGFLYMFFLRQGYDWGGWMNNFFDWAGNLFTPKSIKENELKNELFYNSGNTVPFTKTPIVTQQRVDKILDKITQQGYQFLTEEEKEILKRASKEDI